MIISLRINFLLLGGCFSTFLKTTVRRYVTIWMIFFSCFHVFGADRPNVLLILTDDQGYGDLSLHGNPSLTTPNLDELAGQSVRFERFYVSPVCAPTRASLMTGRYFLRTNVRGVVPMYLATMRTEEVTLAEVLQANDYATGIFGKWHLGSYYPYHPNNQGFDIFLGFRGGETGDYFDPILEYRKTGKANYDVKFAVYKDRKQEFFDEMHGTSARFEGYITDILTERAIDFMDQNHPDKTGRPFFCYLCYNAPHTPVQVPDKYFNKYKALSYSDFNAGIYAMVECIDNNIGKICRFLESSGLDKNIVVLFLSDNGANGGNRFNAGMKGYKGSVNEGGVRVPFFVRWPGKIQPAVIDDQLAADIDVFPTILELCRIPVPEEIHPDGISLLPYLTGEGRNATTDRMLFQAMADESEQGLYSVNHFAIRTNEWRFIYRTNSKSELYDMITDFGQERDVASENPEQVSYFEQQVFAWYRDVVRDGLRRPAIQIGHDFEPVVDLTSRFVYLKGNLKLTGLKPWDRRQVLNWTSTDDYLWWDIEVVEPGRYRVSVTFASGEESRDGSEIYLERNGRILARAIIRRDPYTPEVITDHDRVPKGLLPISERTTQDMGIIDLQEGRANLYLKCSKISGTEPLRLMRLSVEKI